MKRGSALIMALWLIAVLSVMVFSFSYEAHQQAKINLYVRERNSVRRLIEPGRMIGEAVILGYEKVTEYEKGENEEDLDEEDRFYLEKRDLKATSKCTIGPILLDEESATTNTVTIEIQLANSGEDNGININELFKGDGGQTKDGQTATSAGDSNYALRWQMILKNSGIPEDLEVEVPEPDGRGTKRHNLMNLLIASWNDWRDQDSDVSKGPLDDYEPEDDDGAELSYYEELNERLLDEAHSKDERNAARESFVKPRNGPIPDIKELQYVRGFRDFPAVLTGGLLYPKEDEDPEANPRLKGIIDVFCKTGSAKINVNDCTVDQLMSVPGIYNEEAVEDGDMEDVRLTAEAIVAARSVEPEDSDDRDPSLGWWPYKDWNDLKTRVEDFSSDAELKDEAQQYLTFKPDSSTVFKMTIKAQSMGMTHEVMCECYVKESKVRYISWREN
jgi:hypothetical protein